MEDAQKLKLTTTQDLQKYMTDKYAWERKYDGTYALISVGEKGEVEVLGKGKRGKDYGNMFPEIREDLQGWRAGTYKCEIVAWKEGEVKEHFPSIQTRTSSKSGYECMARENPVSIVIFDVVNEGKTYEDRRSVLESLRFFGRRISIAHSARTDEEKRSLVCLREAHDLEGFVIKPKDGAKDGFKWKPEFTEDVWWEGEFVEGKGQHSGKIGSLICYQWVKGVKMDFKVGGMTQAERDELFEQAQSKTDLPQVIEIAHSEYLPSGKLRYPRYMFKRDNKSAAECVRRVE